METIQKGKQTNKTSNTCASDKGKQTNKQTSRGSMCGGADAGGSAELHNMWSLICNASEYTEELQRCIRDALEKHGVQYAGSYSDTLGQYRSFSGLMRGSLYSSQKTHSGSWQLTQATRLGSSAGQHQHK